MDELITFLSARLDEDEVMARKSAAYGGAEHWRVDIENAIRPDPARYNEYIAPGYVDDEHAAHIARHDPARVLREVAAKRAIVAVHAQLNDSIWCQTCDPGADPFGDSAASYPCKTLRATAAVWSDHPDYRSEWAPT